MGNWTLQRRIRHWRASTGPEREVMFAQVHRPGEYAQSDSPRCRASESPSVARRSTICSSISCCRTRTGRRAPSILRRVSGAHRWISSSGVGAGQSAEAASYGQPLDCAHEILDGWPGFHRPLHDGTCALRSGARSQHAWPRGHENGDVEQFHHRLKRAIDQALLLRVAESLPGARSTRSFSARSSQRGIGVAPPSCVRSSIT